MGVVSLTEGFEFETLLTISCQLDALIYNFMVREGPHSTKLQGQGFYGARPILNFHLAFARSPGTKNVGWAPPRMLEGKQEGGLYRVGCPQWAGLQ